MPRRDQNLAVVTWQLIGGLDTEVRGEFRSRAMDLGPRLISCGLAATAAFYEAKAGPAPRKPLERAYRAMADALARHVLKAPAASGGELVTRAGSMDAASYRYASADARAFALWVRRAAEAMIPAAAERGNRDGISPASDPSGPRGEGRGGA
jgi:CRISPR type III-B/RAMP module-associated protein Cmr5